MSREIVDAYPLTPLQKGMLYEVMANPDANLFIGSASFDFQGDLEIGRFRGAWQDAVKLYPVLRTQFIWDGLEEPLQVVLDDCEIEFELIDCSAISDENRNTHSAQLRLEYRRIKIEIDQCPLMFLKLIQWSDSEYTLIWQVHHLIMDAWSASIVFKAVLELYQGNTKLPELQDKQLLSFSDYVQHLNSNDVDESKDYWKRYLESVDKSELNVPAPLDQHSRLSDDGAGQSQDSLDSPKQAIYCINERVWDRQKSHTVKQFCSANSITIAGFIHGAWAILVSAYSNTKVPYFGSVASGRYSGIQGIDSAVGLFINTLPFYARLDSELTIVQWIEDIQTRLQHNQKYGQLGLQDIKQHLAVGLESSVFDTVLSIGPELVIDETDSIDSDLSLPNIQFAVDSDNPLSMIFDPKDQCKVELSFNPSIVHQSTVEQMQADLLFIVDEIISGPVKTSDEILSSLQKKYQIGVQKPISIAADGVCSTDEIYWCLRRG